MTITGRNRWRTWINTVMVGQSRGMIFLLLQMIRCDSLISHVNETSASARSKATNDLGVMGANAKVDTTSAAVQPHCRARYSTCSPGISSHTAIVCLTRTVRTAHLVSGHGNFVIIGNDAPPVMASLHKTSAKARSNSNL